MSVHTHPDSKPNQASADPVLALANHSTTRSGGFRFQGRHWGKQSRHVAKNGKGRQRGTIEIEKEIRIKIKRIPWNGKRSFVWCEVGACGCVHRELVVGECGVKKWWFCLGCREELGQQRRGWVFVAVAEVGRGCPSQVLRVFGGCRSFGWWSGVCLGSWDVVVGSWVGRVCHSPPNCCH